MSDLSINSSKFGPDAVSNEHKTLMAMIRQMPRDQPWWEIGMPEYRRREAAGELEFKPPRLDSRANILLVPSRDAGRDIHCRYFVPTSSDSGNGVLLFIHGGGWTVFGCDINDLLLAHIADTTGIAVVSVEYRLAPEFPFPCGPQDCYDVAHWLTINSKIQFGMEFSFVAGSSSGAHFAALTVLHLRKELPSFHLKGVVLNYGMYDLTYSHPSIVNASDAFIVTQQALESTTDAFVPSTTLESRRDPRISPFYADLQALSPLPRALFICGTEDILIDDSIFFATRWMIVNNNTKFQVFPGAFHGFVDFAGMPFAKEGWDCITTFLKGNISGA